MRLQVRPSLTRPTEESEKTLERRRGWRGNERVRGDGVRGREGYRARSTRRSARESTGIFPRLRVRRYRQIPEYMEDNSRGCIDDDDEAAAEEEARVTSSYLAFDFFFSAPAPAPAAAAAAAAASAAFSKLSLTREI